jgi:hypothetical protein
LRSGRKFSRFQAPSRDLERSTRSAHTDAVRPTIGAAITAGYWFLWVRCPACRTTQTLTHAAGEWPRQAFRKRGVQYEPSEQPKNSLYTDLLPKLNSRTIRLLDNTRSINQLAALERRTSRGGKDTIDHPPGGHDDVANVIAGVAACVSNLARTTWSQQPLGV